MKKKQAEEEERQRQRQLRQNQQDAAGPNQPEFGVWSANTQTQLGEWTLRGGMGFFPSLFGLQFQTFPPDNAARRPVGASHEAERQHFLSRLVLVLLALVFASLLAF